MLKTICCKVMWAGKAATFTVGLAVMLALVMGVTTMALAAVPGDPFKLGKTNTIDAISSLVGSRGSALLRVENNSTNTSATALDLQTEPGTPPMTVNRSTKVKNLNADKVDGKDAPILVVVNADGTLSTNDTVATVEHQANSGYYQLDFNRPVVGCVFQATLVNGPDGGEIAVYPSDAVVSRLAVITTKNGAVFSDRYDRTFHLILYC
jgi:hypothetical protein